MPPSEDINKLLQKVIGSNICSKRSAKWQNVGVLLTYTQELGLKKTLQLCNISNYRFSNNFHDLCQQKIQNGNIC